MMLSIQPIDVAVAQAYAAFNRHRVPLSLEVCDHCVPDDIEKQLRSTPLKQVPAVHLYKYNCSAKGPTQPVGEVAYFLPRMFELMAQEVNIHHSNELNLDRMGRCPAGSWNEQELAAINAFALGFFDRTISAKDGAEMPLAVLLMFHIGGVDLTPLLHHWRASSDPMTIVNFVIDTYSHFWERDDYSNPFATDQPEFRQTIRTWMAQPETRARFLEKLRAPDFLAVSDGITWAENAPFSLMVETAFEKLSVRDS